MSHPKAVFGALMLTILAGLWACTSPPETRQPTTAPECIYVPPEPVIPPPNPFKLDRDHDGLTSQQRMDFIRRSVASTIRVRVRRYSAEKGCTFHYGTGVFIDEQHALTAEHVVAGHTDLYVVLRRVVRGKLLIGQVRVEKAKVLAANAEHDVALLKVQAPSELVHPMPIAKNWRPRKNALLWQFGVRTFWSRGRVVRQMPPTAHPTLRGLVQMRQLGQCGDSGGPVTNTRGELVGLVLRGNSECSRQFFVPIDTALKAVGLAP